MLTEKEELELLELENENAQVQPATQPQAQTQAEPEKKTGILANVGLDLSKRGQSLMQNAARQESFPEYAIQQTGELAGGIGDIAGRLTAPIGKGISSLAQKYTPALYGAGKATGEAIGRGISKALPDLPKTLEDPSNKAETARSMANILSLGLGAKVAKPFVGMAAKGAEGGTKLAGEALEEFGKNAPNRILKPKERDFNAGFKPENVYKHEVDGTLDQTIKKTQDKIESLAADLKMRIQAGDDAGARVNAFEHIDRTIEKMKGEGVKNLNKNAAIKHLQGLKEEIAISNPNGILDLADAQDFKRAVGSEGAWYESKWGKMIDKDANAKEKAFSNLYTEIKTDIEQKAPEGIREINNQLSELIPIENTALKRLYVAKRNEPISLKDMIGIATIATTGIKGAPVYLLNKAANSPLTGKLAYKAGMAIQGKSNKPIDIPEFKAKQTAEAIPEESNLEIPAYLRKGRSPLPEQPLETAWKKPVYTETPRTAKAMQIVEDFNKRKQELPNIEGIDNTMPEDAASLSRQVTEKKKLPVTLPVKTNLPSDEMKREILKSVSSLTTKKSEDIFNKGSGFVKAVKEQAKNNPNSISDFIDSMTEEERSAFIKKIRGEKTTVNQDKLLSSKELAEKLIPSSLMTQRELSKLRW